MKYYVCSKPSNVMVVSCSIPEQDGHHRDGSVLAQWQTAGAVTRLVDWIGRCELLARERAHSH